MADKTPQNTNPPPSGDSPGYGYGYGYGASGYGYPQYGGQYYGGSYGGQYYGGGSQYGYSGGQSGYGGYAEGYGYAQGYGPQQGGNAPGVRILSLKDYLLMVRERFWYLVLSVVILTSAFLLANMQKTDEYEAAAKLRIHRRPFVAAGLGVSPDIDTVGNFDDFMTLIGLMRSNIVTERVLLRMSNDLKARVIAPYQNGNIFTGPLRPLEVLEACRNIIPERGTMFAAVSYRHPDGAVAKLMAQYFVEEIRDYNNTARKKAMAPLLEVSDIHLKQLDNEIDSLYKQRGEMLKQNPRLFDLETVMNLASSELHSLNSSRLAEESVYLTTKRLWDRLVEVQKKPNAREALLDMPYIASAERVATLRGEIMRHRINIETGKVRYADEHPSIKTLRTSMDQTEKELDRAIAEAVEKLREQFDAAKRSYEAANKRVLEKRNEIADLYQQQTQITSIVRKIGEKQAQKSAIDVSFYSDKLKASGGMLPNIEILEKAELVSSRPINKDYPKMAILGLIAGIVVGLIIVFSLAFLDDRVKSAADIEGFLRLPLVGILPIARRSSSFDKARVVEGDRDRPVKEAFRSIYSALRINEGAKQARTFLITSTSPSEGKSFVSTNLALTYAAHGERVLLIDADLRMPVVAKTLRLEGDHGITQYFLGKVALEDAIHYGVANNLDVLTVGAPCTNPTQILSSRKFAEMITTLKSCYDRVIVDSPPVGAVSDALNLVSMVDGVLYVVRFNTVKKRFIRSNIGRLRESKVPIFGAILNQIGMSVVHYYTNTGDRSYHRYYTRVSKNALNVPIEENE
ncbi:MAG: polysaccharide biosynthesis tyrosine autokinase [Puniceicoccales bacterium]|jgi:capsular exopolysaccharide synthesis family protein|nr:polysaccharide biosynthesis tyrosine autokinase [Puniceicoccales bacterium]